MSKIKHITSLLLFFILFAFCGESDTTPKVPPIKGSIWAGGVDGGAWIKLDSINNEIFYAEIFNENNTLWHKGTFKLNSGKFSLKEIRENLSSYDGKDIHLKYDRIFLTPVKMKK